MISPFLVKKGYGGTAGRVVVKRVQSRPFFSWFSGVKKVEQKRTFLSSLF